MGIFSYLKKKDKKDFSKLDIPPAPPTEELPEFPSIIRKERPESVEIIKPKELKKEVKKIEKKPVEIQKPEPEDVHEKVRPVFIRAGAFKDVLDEIMLINNILKESDDTVTRVSDFKEDQDKEFKMWESHLKNIQQKLTYVDKILFGIR